MTPAEIRAAMEAHAIACRVAIAELRPRPEMPRDLADANLTGANLAGGRNVHGAAPLDGSGAAFSSRSQR